MPLCSRSAFALLVFGLLAPGVLPAREQDPYLVRDINQRLDEARGLASLEVLTTSGGPYYSFDDGVHGPELWRGEGVGASMVHDLCPGRCGSSPRDFAELAGLVYFFANDGSTGWELWRTDGTSDGTVLVRDLCPGRCSTRPDSGSSLVGIGDALFFRAFRSGNSLWTSDGTREGTRLAANTSGIYDLTAIGDILYFRAIDSEHGTELWSSDGAETALVRDDCPGECSSGPARDLPDLFTPYGDNLFYWQLAGDRWRLRAVRDDPFAQGHAIEYVSTSAPRLTPVGSSLLVTSDNQLQRIDIPTFAVTTVCSFPNRVGAAVALGSSLFFKVRGSGGAFELWRSDGTEAGTQRLGGFQEDLSVDGDLMAVAGQIFFTTAAGLELWASDGTAGGTRSLDRPWGSIPVMGMTPDPSAQRLLLVAGDPRWQKAELWATDGSSFSLVRHSDSIPGSTGLRTLTALGDVLFFGARERLSEAYRPWRSDGTESGTEILSTTISNPMDAASFQGRLIFPAGNAIWTTDGTAPGTRVLLDGFAADHLKVVGDRIWFSGRSFRDEPDASTGFELWSSDGTIAGTRMAGDIVPGNGSSSPRQITPVGSSVFFLTTTPESGTELWSSGVTPGDTRFRFKLCTGPCDLAPQHLTAFAGRLFFTDGSQLFSSNPASSGALPLLSIGRSIPDPVVFQGRLFFFAESISGREYLWSSDGTTPGTVRLQEVSGEDQPRTSHEPTVVGERFYFTSWTEDAGQEIWVSDGTVGGTSLLADVRPGQQGSTPRHLTAAGEHLFFAADDGNAGRELWKTDGTAAGTRRVGDIFPGPGSAAPADLTPTGKHLFFSADDGQNGRELWALVTVEEPTEEPYTRCAPAAGRLCLHDGRFEVSAEFRDPLAGGAAKPATAIPDSDESGFFWFFAPGNLELVVKLLDGRASNGQFWVFFGALSDVEYTVTVTDRSTGAVQTYRNPRGTFCGQADTAAFPDPGEATPPVRSVLSMPATASAAAGACIPGSTALCLGGGRFRAEARWKDHRGVEGTATAVPRTDESGTFWFFSPGNVELVVKVLDGTPVNGKLWVFYGALSDVEYWLTVTDTVTGAAKTWHNPPGSYCGRGDTSAF